MAIEAGAGMARRQYGVSHAGQRQRQQSRFAGGARHVEEKIEAGRQPFDSTPTTMADITARNRISCCYPNWDSLGVAAFTNKLAELPRFRCLMVMMEQCHSGGFNSSVISKE
jgi:hypothetical protein